MISHPGRYKLVSKVAILCPVFIEWADWLETADLRVARDEVGPCIVSTVFLGLDFNIYDDGDPLLFETMILGDNEEYYQVRTSTWGQAEAAHAEAVTVARARVATANMLLPDNWR